jgi:hypothetical protein
VTCLTFHLSSQNKKSNNAEIQNGPVDLGGPPNTTLVFENVVSASPLYYNVKAEGDVDQINEDTDEVKRTDDIFLTESIEVASIDSDDTFDDTDLLPLSSSEFKQERADDVTISRQDGRILIAAPRISDVVVMPSGDNTASMENESFAENNAANNSDWDSWETVEVRGRGNRRKLPPPPPPPPVALKQSSNSMPPSSGVPEPVGNNIKKLKNTRSNPTPRKKSVARKIVREILSSVVDSIDEESRKMKQLRITSPTRAVNSWKNGPPGVTQKIVRNEIPVGMTDNIKCETTMRDVVVGKGVDSNASSVNIAAASTLVHHEEGGKPAMIPNKVSEKEFPETEKPARKADQNTAPTYQDTASSSSNARGPSKEEPQNAVDRKSDTCSSDTEEAPQRFEGEAASKLDAVDTLSPPLLTLLSPENANSATSSVASSLEAPHRGRLHHHSDAATDVNDVGYHLLDVCDRLSRDMSLFMSRRALALSARRRERGAILSALQNSVSSIWPGRCHVELYGSCATQLDLPSSDIDVVVLGLHQHSYVPTQISSINHSKSSSNDSIALGTPMDEGELNDDIQQPMMLQLAPSPSFGMLPQHRNAERVVSLASDLESQVWAVQVNAIPTASVPVIKVLADPSKLVGASNGGDWMTQHQQMAGQVAVAAGGVASFENKPNPEYSKADSGSYPPPTHVPWRGSDVMKGLLSLDITFEGPEHGGIGSTEFSSRTVAEACIESGLHPDATPFVQTLMVLKELLAQRKLNEPYSGGLSSYALLLLVLALVRERSVIREEIELVEQQKRAMAVGELDSFASGSIPSFEPTTLTTPQTTQSATADASVARAIPPTSDQHVGLSIGNESNSLLPNGADKASKGQTRGTSQSQTKPQPILKQSSSWATIAKGNTGAKARSTSSTSKTDIETDASKQPTVESSSQKQTFADAVAGSKRRTPPVSTNVTSLSEKHGVKTDDVVQKSASTSQTPSGMTSAVSNAELRTPANGTTNVSPMDAKIRAPAFYPQGYNDIVEVLCSGEITSGKLLMHFLLYYGEHFDAQSTAIDISGKHERNYYGQTPLNSYLTPYIQRQSLGNIDPITGMLTVDPIIIYDPLEGAENNNVARRCFAWNSVRWIFAQSYATLASAVERSATPPTTPGGGPAPQAMARESESDVFSFSPDGSGDLMDPSSPLLRCLLSF